jgi:hypothetical protein
MVGKWLAWSNNYLEGWFKKRVSQGKNRKAEKNVGLKAFYSALSCGVVIRADHQLVVESVLANR